MAPQRCAPSAEASCITFTNPSRGRDYLHHVPCCRTYLLRGNPAGTTAIDHRVRRCTLHGVDQQRADLLNMILGIPKVVIRIQSTQLQYRHGTSSLDKESI